MRAYMGGRILEVNETYCRMSGYSEQELLTMNITDIRGVKWQAIRQPWGDGNMDYILRDIDAELWSEVKAEATLESKTMREVIFEALKWYITPMGITPRNTTIWLGEERKAEGLK